MTEQALLTDLTERYGPMLTIEQLAELLGRRPHSVRTSLRLENHSLAPLARRRCKIGRRVYFLAVDVADFIESSMERPH
ncbi:MAG: plasmid-related protein [Salinisphaeraceae bacterium]|nr:plasmid-related protein [Salinisphaeraceae bacterium]